MTRFIALLKALLRSYFGISSLKAQAAGEKRIYLKKLGLIILIIAALAPTVVLYTKLLIKGFEVLAGIGQERAILSFGVVMVSAIIFFFGIFYVINFFYLAEDVRSLLYLPLSGWQVLGARFCVMLGFEYLTALPFVLPPLLVYGIKSGAIFIYWIYVLLALLLIPLVPLSLAAVPTVIIMRFANVGRHKDMFKILGGVAVIALAVAYQLVFSKSAPELTNPTFLQNLLTDRNGLMNIIGRFFPSAKIITGALVNADNVSGLLRLLEFVLISAGALILAWLVGDRQYFKGLIGADEISARRKKLSEADWQRVTRVHSSALAYCAKEIRLLLRTPTYFLNCVLTNFLVPVVLIIPILFQKNSHTKGIPWNTLLNGSAGESVLLSVVVGLVIFIASTNAITATSLSREGREFYISKYLPLAYRQQMLAKIMSAYIFGVIAAVLIIAAAYIIIPFKPVLGAIMLLECLAAILPVAEAGLLIDILRPKLKWENEQNAVKQNLNVLFSMMFAVLFGGAIIYTVIRYVNSLSYAALLMLLYFCLAGVILFYLLQTWGVKTYCQLEG